ncbi:DUF58 domain-containing protein [Cellulomonas sp. HZM]|uniref:DUF58 domain-containing protein n=1 Tax=Cellulomonas sp. HZM TaxID=1454010 RepID=UPI0004935A95|nr:DUF58 domain-containing protein [Cellulomonas sp. HZM]
MSPSWSRARGATLGAAAGALVLLAGALAGRPDVAVLGVAPVLAAAWAWRSRPSSGVGVALVDDDEGAQAVPGALHAQLVVATPAGSDAVLVRVRRGPRAVRSALLRVDPSSRRRSVPLVVRTVRTGPQTLAEVDVTGVGVAAASVSDTSDAISRDVLVLPAPVPLAALPLPPRLRGLTGAHDSRRPGEGGSLRDVHPFAPGDRLRRIDWRVTARRSPDLRELYVRREHALAEAVVVLVVDSRDDVGPDPTTWRGSTPPAAGDATSLDIARQAAASIAQGFLELGDRVGLDDLAAVRRPLPPGGGRRQLDRIRHALAVSAPVGEPPVRVRAPQLPSGALVVVLSTFLDDGPAHAAAQWRSAGHRVVAIDTLPELRTRHLGAREQFALRLVRIAREDRLAALAGADVEVVAWRRQSAMQLAQLARRAQRRVGAGAR